MNYRRAEPTRVAIDTCLLLDMFLDEEPAFAERTEHIFKSPDYEVYLPTFVGVETIATRSMRLNAQIAPITNAHIDAAQKFLDSADVRWIELDEWAMRRAQELGPQRLIAPSDAAILACAIEAECRFLYTKDKQLIRTSEGLEEITVDYPPRLSGVQTEIQIT